MIPCKRLAQATATVHPISGCPFAMYQVLSITQINNQKSRASPTQTWIALGKLVDTYNFEASPFLHYTISLGPSLAGPCPKVVFLAQPPLL